MELAIGIVKAIPFPGSCILVFNSFKICLLIVYGVIDMIRLFSVSVIPKYSSRLWDAVPVQWMIFLKLALCFFNNLIVSFSLPYSATELYRL